MTAETATNTPSHRGVPPFNHRHLDELMEAEGIDGLIVTSKHNVQYMLGGYRFFMFDYMDAIGLSRYLPIFIYSRGRPEESAYIANPHETFEQELGRFWVSNIQAKSRMSTDAISPSALPSPSPIAFEPRHRCGCTLRVSEKSRSP